MIVASCLSLYWCLYQTVGSSIETLSWLLLIWPVSSVQARTYKLSAATFCRLFVPASLTSFYIWLLGHLSSGLLALGNASHLYPSRHWTALVRPRNIQGFVSLLAKHGPPCITFKYCNMTNQFSLALYCRCPDTGHILRTQPRLNVACYASWARWARGGNLLQTRCHQLGKIWAKLSNQQLLN